MHADVAAPAKPEYQIVRAMPGAKAPATFPMHDWSPATMERTLRFGGVSHAWPIMATY